MRNALGTLEVMKGGSFLACEIKFSWLLWGLASNLELILPLEGSKVGCGVSASCKLSDWGPLHFQGLGRNHRCVGKRSFFIKRKKKKKCGGGFKLSALGQAWEESHFHIAPMFLRWSAAWIAAFCQDSEFKKCHRKRTENKQTRGTDGGVEADWPGTVWLDARRSRWVRRLPLQPNDRPWWGTQHWVGCPLISLVE